MTFQFNEASAITKRHEAHARAIRGLRNTQRVGEVLMALLALTFAACVWIADNLHIATGMGCLSVFVMLCTFWLRDVHRHELDRYRQRCNRGMAGFEAGYHDALACTKLHRFRDADAMIGYEDGYVHGIDERNTRIRKAVTMPKKDAPVGDRSYLQDIW